MSVYYSASTALIAAAVIPAIFLLIRVYKLDKVEKESPRLLLKLVILGILSTLIAIIGETVGEAVLSFVFRNRESVLYRLLMYFVVVGISEELGKYAVLKKATWSNSEYNCLFDGMIYAVFVSLGFALWENIKYTLSFGLTTALLRAVTAVPGHACFGVFMGFFYGMARRAENSGQQAESLNYRRLAVIVPVLIHGAYDFIATSCGDLIFVMFIAALFILSFACIRNVSKNDRYL